jgi:hypothetical protein
MSDVEFVKREPAVAAEDLKRTNEALSYLIDEVRRIYTIHGGDYYGIGSKRLELACDYAERIRENRR